MGGAAAKMATGEGLTVIVLVLVIVLLHGSVKAQVSVTGPPHGPGNALKVEVTVPLMRHVPLPPFV